MAALSLDLQEHRFPAAGQAPSRPVLAHVRLAVEPGERLAIIGPSGCGKTTLLNIVAGLVKGFAGRLELAPATKLAYVFQEPRLLPWRTLGDNLRLVLPERPDPGARIRAILAEVGLEAALDV
ncbi:MAG: ATP-binding cassette domain-containing protein, partial [Geminicoccaceae bacterium]